MVEIAEDRKVGNLCYKTHDLWLGRVYRFASSQDVNIDREKSLRCLIENCESKMTDIETICKGAFSGSRAEDKFTHISYPPLSFDIDGIKHDCNIVINPCIKYPDYNKYGSKVWVIIGSHSKKKTGELRGYFNSLKCDYAEAIETVVQSSLASLGKCHQTYEILIRNVGLEVSEDSKINELIGRDESHVLDDIIHDEEVQAVLKDLLSIHFNKEIEDPMDEVLLSDISWRTIRDKRKKLLYATEVQSEISKLTGVANFIDYDTMHEFMRPKVLRVINSI